MVKNLTKDETREQLHVLGIETSPLESFAFLDQADNIRYDWHAHTRHQLLYAFSGMLRLEAENGLYLLPPQRAVWIPAGVLHRTTLQKVCSGSVFLTPSLVPTGIAEVRIISADPIIREMVHYALRWPVTRDSDDQLANTWFRTIGLLCAEWIREEMPFHLPAARTDQVAIAIEYTLQNLELVTIEGAAGAAALSERHFRRRFAMETGITWRLFLHQARMLRAMELLVEANTNITEVAYTVGFNSLSAFAKSFALFSGQTPSNYRRLASPASSRAIGSWPWGSCPAKRTGP
jgi:AraC-like DNA-binding protein